MASVRLFTTGILAWCLMCSNFGPTRVAASPSDFFKDLYDYITPLPCLETLSEILAAEGTKLDYPILVTSLSGICQATCNQDPYACSVSPRRLSANHNTTRISRRKLVSNFVDYSRELLAPNLPMKIKDTVNIEGGVCECRTDNFGPNGYWSSWVEFKTGTSGSDGIPIDFHCVLDDKREKCSACKHGNDGDLDYMGYYCTMSTYQCKPDRIESIDVNYCACSSVSNFIIKALLPIIFLS